MSRSPGASVDGTRPALGRALRGWREREGLSRPEAARRLGVVHTTLRGWEVRGTCPQPLHLAGVARALDLTWAEARALAGPDRVRTGGTSGGPSASPLCRARLAAAMTMTQVARRVGVGPATVSRWENGHRTPGPAVRARLATALRLTPEQLEVALSHCPPSRSAGAVLPGLGAMRRDAGLTQQRFRIALGIGAGTAAAWEHGRVRVPAARLAEVAAVLGTDESTLRSRGSRPPDPVPGPWTLAGLRRSAGLTQQEMAVYLGVSRRTVVHWEGGTRPVPLAAVRPMARCTRRPLRTVLTAAGLQLPPLARPTAWAPPDLPHVLDTLRRSSGWSAAALGRRLGVTGSLVRAWERGGSRPPAAACARLELIHGLPRGSLTRLLVPRPLEAGTPVRPGSGRTVGERAAQAADR